MKVIGSMEENLRVPDPTGHKMNNNSSLQLVISLLQRTGKFFQTSPAADNRTEQHFQKIDWAVIQGRSTISGTNGF